MLNAKFVETFDVNAINTKKKIKNKKKYKLHLLGPKFLFSEENICTWFYLKPQGTCMDENTINIYYYWEVYPPFLKWRKSFMNHLYKYIYIYIKYTGHKVKIITKNNQKM